MLRHAPILLFAVLITCVLAPLAAFGLAWQYTDLRAANGTQGVYLETSDGTTPAAEFRAYAEAFARDRNITVTVEYLSPDIPITEIQLYSTGVISPTQTESFIRGNTVTTYPLANFPIDDARYLYALSGPNGTAEEFLALAKAAGYDGMTLHTNVVDLLLGSQSSLVIALLALTTFTATATHAIVRTRATGISRLHGQGLGQILATELRSIALPSVSAIAIAIITSALGLFFYNGLAGLGLFSIFAGAIAAIAAIFGALGYLAGYAVSCSTGILGAIKGAEPGRVLFFGVSVVRLLTLLLALTLAGSTTAALVEYSARSADTTAWRERSAVLAIGFAGGSSSDYGTFAPALRELDVAGDLLLTDPGWALGITPTEHPLILANRVFAAREAGIDLSTLPNDPRTVTIASPSKPTSGWTRDVILETIDFEASLSDAPPPPIAEVTYSPGREVFSYDPTAHATISDPILVILPPGLSTLSDRNLTAAMTRSKALLVSQEGVDKLRAVSPAIGAASPIADKWAQSFAQARTNAFNFGYPLLIALILSTFLAAATALSYQLIHSRRLSVGFLLGRHPWQDRLGLAFIEGVFIALPTFWITHRLTVRAQQVSIQMPDTLTLGFQSAMSPAMIALTIGCVASWAAVSIFTVTCLDAYRKEQL